MTHKRAKALGLALLTLLSVVATTATVPMSASATVPSGVSADQTPDETVDAGETTTVADLTFNTAGNVSNVTVDLTNTGSADVQGYDVATVTVSLRNTSTGTEVASAVSSAAGTSRSFSFGRNHTGVDRLVVTATATRHTDGAVLDAVVSATDAPGTSAFLTSTANTQTITSGVDRELLDGGVYWQGQRLLANGTNATYSLPPSTNVVLTDADDHLVLERQTDPDGAALIDTSTLEGQYTLEEGTSVKASFQVAVQSLSTAFAADSMANEGAGSTTDLEIDSNRGTFTAEISANGLDEAELEQIFGANDGVDDDVLHLQVSGGEAIPADFAGIDAGAYDFAVEASDTTASGTASIDVSEPGDESALFPASIVDVERGDIAEFTVIFQHTDAATVTIGGPEVNYESELALTDGDGDGEVVVRMNTYVAGRLSVANESEAYDVADADDRIDVTRTTPSTPLDEPLQTGDYERTVEVQRGASSVETDVGTLFIGERSTDAVNVWTAPAGETVSSVEDIHQALNAGTLTEDSQIAVEDQAVLAVSVTGVFGVIDDAPGTSTTGKLQNLAANESIVVELIQTNPAANQEPLELDLSGPGVTAVSDAENDSLYVVLDLDTIQFTRDGVSVTDVAEAGDQWEAAFSVRTPSRLVDENESVGATLEFVEGRATFRGLTVDDELPLPAVPDAAVQGTSTLAPGTRFTIRLRSSATNAPFLKQRTVTVQPDGTWSATLDLSGLPDDTTFAASIIGPIATVRVSGFIGEPVADGGARTVVVTQPSPTPRVVTEEVTRTVERTFVQERTVERTVVVTQTTGQPGFGIAVTVVALLATARLAVRRRD